MASYFASDADYRVARAYFRAYEKVAHHVLHEDIGELNLHFHWFSTTTIGEKQMWINTFVTKMEDIDDPFDTIEFFRSLRQLLWHRMLSLRFVFETNSFLLEWSE
jgi:hypothetical protein